MSKKTLIEIICILITSLGTAQSQSIILDSVSGFYLTEKHEGFTGENYETLLLQEEPAISVTEINAVSQSFDSFGKPVVLLEFNAIGTKKLEKITTENKGEPLVIYFGKKIVLAPFIMSPITEGKMIINGNFTIQETDGMVNWLKSRIEK